MLSHLRVRSRYGIELVADLGTIYDLREGWLVHQVTYWEWQRTLDLAGVDRQAPSQP